MYIKNLRKAANLTQMDVALEMGVDRTAVSNWERGVSLPRAEQLPRLARILGCSIDALFGQSPA